MFCALSTHHAQEIVNRVREIRKEYSVDRLWIMTDIVRYINLLMPIMHYPDDFSIEPYLILDLAYSRNRISFSKDFRFEETKYIREIESFFEKLTVHKRMNYYDIIFGTNKTKQEFIEICHNGIENFTRIQSQDIMDLIIKVENGKDKVTIDIYDLGELIYPIICKERLKKTSEN